MGALVLMACMIAPALARADETGRVGLYEQAQIVVPARPAARARHCRHQCETPGRVMEASAPMDIRTAPQLVATADRYRGARNFTGLRGPWCAAALRMWLRMTGHSIAGTDNRAISFAHYGRASGPRVGSIAVMRHHVGIVAGFKGGNPVLLSGNHGHRVGVGVYSARRIIAYREPV